MKTPVGNGDARNIFTDNWEDHDGSGNDLSSTSATVVLPFKNGAVFVEISTKDGDIEILYLPNGDPGTVGVKEILFDGEAIRFPNYPWRALKLTKRTGTAIRWTVTALGE